MQAMDVTNQVSMDVPDVAQGATCDHAHSEPPPALPPTADSHSPSLTSVEVRSVYVPPKLMNEFMHFAKVRSISTHAADANCAFCVLIMRFNC